MLQSQTANALSARSTAEERVRGLLDLGFTAGELGDVLGVSSSAVRNWSTGQATPRPGHLYTIDDLRAVALALVEGSFTDEEAGIWLKSRNHKYLDNHRPIDRITEDPMAVIMAAHNDILDAQTADAKRQPVVHGV